MWQRTNTIGVETCMERIRRGQSRIIKRERVQEGLMIIIDEQKAVLPLGIMIRLRGVLNGIWRTNAWVRGYMNA